MKPIMSKITLETTTGVMLSLKRFNELIRKEWVTEVVPEGLFVTITANNIPVGLVVPQNTTMGQLTQIAYTMFGNDWVIPRHLRCGFGGIYEDKALVTGVLNYPSIKDKRSIRLFW